MLLRLFSDENLDYTVLQSIGKWLEAIGMEKYLKSFTEKGISTPRQLLGLTLEDLEKIGIGPIGHRKKIFKAIQSTRVQVGFFPKFEWYFLSHFINHVPASYFINLVSFDFLDRSYRWQLRKQSIYDVLLKK